MAASREPAQFQTAAGHSLTQPGLVGCGGSGKWPVVCHWLYYCYDYCFLSICVVQVNSSYLTPQGSIFTFFLLPGSGGVGMSEEAAAWCSIASWVQTTTVVKQC